MSGIGGWIAEHKLKSIGGMEAELCVHLLLDLSKYILPRSGAWVVQDFCGRPPWLDPSPISGIRIFREVSKSYTPVCMLRYMTLLLSLTICPKHSTCELQSSIPLRPDAA